MHFNSSLEPKSFLSGKKVGIIQRILPVYRIPFFDALAVKSDSNLQVLAGQPRLEESLKVSGDLTRAIHVPANNWHIGGGKAYMCWQRNAMRWLHDFHPDVLIVEANPRLISSHLIISQMQRWDKPVIGWGLGKLDWSSPSWTNQLREKLLNSFYRRFDILIAYGKKGASQYQQAGIESQCIYIANNAVSDEGARELDKQLQLQPDLLDQWKAAHGLTEKPIVLFVGRLIKDKRIDDLIRACEPLSEICHLVIVGDGKHRTALESLALGILPATQFLGDQRGVDLAMAFAASSLFVLPGLGGLAIFEAMLYGKPLVVATGDGTQEALLIEGENGFSVTEGNVVEMTKAIEKCVTDQALCRRMGARSKQIIEGKYSLTEMVSVFTEALRFVMK